MANGFVADKLSCSDRLVYCGVLICLPLSLELQDYHLRGKYYANILT